MATTSIDLRAAATASLLGPLDNGPAKRQVPVQTMKEIIVKFKSTVTALSIFAATGFVTLAHAQTAAPAASGAMPMSDVAMTDGEVRKIDKENKKITLKHGEIKNLGMPGMTMVFQVKDPAMLDSVKQGDKVMFKAEKANGALTVTEMMPAK